MLTPLEIQDLVVRKALVFEDEGINTVEYWAARCGVPEEQLLEWCASEYVGTIESMSEIRTVNELIQIICISSFIQGMVFGSQLSDLDLEVIEI